MRRVVVTGMGIVSSIGNNTQEVLASLREAKSGITRAEEFAEHGFRCQVQGMPTLDPAGSIDRRAMRFLGPGAAWNHVAMEQAIRDCGVEESDIVQSAHRHRHGLGRPLDPRPWSKPPTSPARTIARSASGRSPCPRRCPRPRRRRSPPGSRSRASTIRSRRPARHPTIASAMPPRLIQWGKQDMVFAGGSRGAATGRCRTCSTPWARCRPKYNDTPADGLARL